MVTVVCAAWLAPGPSAGTPREPSAASVASYVEFADRKNDVVDAPAPPAPLFFVVSPTTMAAPAAAVKGAVTPRI